jgi:hypothetical protein
LLYCYELANLALIDMCSRILMHPHTTLVSLKAFVREIAYGIDSAEGIEETCQETVRKYWNNFTVAWRRADPEKPREIPRDIARSVTHVCLFARSDLFVCCELNLMQFQLLLAF